MFPPPSVARNGVISFTGKARAHIVCVAISNALKFAFEIALISYVILFFQLFYQLGKGKY